MRVAASGILAVRVPRDRVIFGAYLALVMVAAHGLIVIRNLPGSGVVLVLGIMLIVIASDAGGYFGGRLIGGPKFWPQVSPKKTWSGTVTGWVLAALVGGAFAEPLGAGTKVVALSVLLAFAGQMGDIAESAIKRRYGVKDSSNLIPGHGGMLDRFDALIAVAAGVLLIVLVAGARFS